MKLVPKSFEEWVSITFDHQHGWDWIGADDYWDFEADRVQSAEFIQRLFENPQILIDRFTPEQIGQGIESVIHETNNPAYLLIDPSIPLNLRLSCIRHISTLYHKLFVRICPVHYCHLDDGPESPNGATTVCCMFWDIFPMFPRTKHDEVQKMPEVRDRWQEHLAIEDACIWAMEDTLRLDHPACQEGALHGLGHWCHGYPSRVQPIIDAFLQRDVTTEIREYAAQARTGCIL